MRKFTLLFAFLLSLIGVTQAQTVITDLNSLSNGKVYTLTGERGTLLTFDGATMLYGTFAGDKEGVAYDASDPYQQFAIVKADNGNMYLYSVGAKKFVNQSGNTNPLSSSPNQMFVVAPASAPSGNNMWLLKVNNNMINFSRGYNNAGMCANYNSEDPGNRFTITEVDGVVFADQTAVESVINEYEAWKSASASWTATTMPTISTDDAPVYYSIKNLRSGKYAHLTTLGSRLQQSTLQTEAGGVWYFVSAGEPVTNDDDVTATPVYIKNAATDLAITNPTAAGFSETGTVFYIIPCSNEGVDGFAISTATVLSGTHDSWHNNGNVDVVYWGGNAAASVWAFYPTVPGFVAEAAAGEADLFARDFSTTKNAAIAEAQATGTPAYYACSEENINACLATINAQEVTSYASLVTAKENINSALSTLRTSERIRPLQGGETVIFENRNKPGNYLSTNAADATAETEAVEASEVKWFATQDLKSLWEVVAVGDGTFKLRNALSGKYIQHLENDNNLKLLSSEEATPYVFTNQDLHYILIGAEGFNNRKYINWRNNNNISSWSDVNDKGNQWNVIAPAQELLDELNNLRTPLDDLKAAAITAANARVDEIEASDDALDFYTYDADKIAELRTIISNMINGATTHAELTEVQVELNDLLNDFVIYEGNRTNPLTAGTKVKFLNKKVNTNYMTTDANGATTSSELTSASIWELVANDEATGFYLYNNLSDKYLKHATADGGQATLVAKAEATLYNVQPMGQHVVIGEVTPTSVRAYVHCDDPTNKITRYLAESDRSLWTVTSATEAENSQLASDIQTNITTQLDAAVAAANAVVDPYKALEFYRPTQAIDAYEAAIAIITGVDTYDELAAALEAITAAQTAFETAIAADDVVLENPVSDGEQVKFFNRQHSTYITVAGDGAEMSASLNFEAGAVWTLKSATNGGFYLYSPVANAYAKHPTGNNKALALVSSTEDASIYYVHSNGLYVTVGTLAEQSTEENSLDYLHGVNWVGYQKGYNVVRWNAVAQASHWTISSVTPEELAQANNAIKEKVTEELATYKASAQETVNAMAALTYYKATTEAVNAYADAVNSLTATSYEDLVVAKAKVDSALAVFMVAPRDESTALSANTRVKFVNKANPALWMNTNAGGVTAEAAEGLETIWTLKANNENTGFYLLNELEGKYVKHPEDNGNQATLVGDMAEASLYRIQPNGFHINLVADVDAEENSLHYGAERYVTRWVANHDASLWNFEVVSAEQFQALLAHDLDSCKQLALLRIGVAAKSAFYAPTADAISLAQTSVEAVDAAAVATLADFKVAMESINAAMTTMYTDGLNNGASPQGSNKLLRLRNKLYPTHFLGFGEDGLYHYETVETGGNVMPVDDDVDPGMTSGEVDILHSTESTIWNLETPTGSVPDERMYLKNVMIQSYAEHQYYDNWHVKLALKQAEAHPEIIELVGVVRDADNNMSIKYEDMSFAESGEKCFLVYTTEGTSSTNNALFAAQNGTIVNGARTSDASMWAIAEATDIECANMGDYSVFAYHQYVFAPTINMAKQYYCETTESVEDEEGNTSTVTTVVDYIDGAKAGYYGYAGGIKNGEGNEITDIEEFQTYYWTCLKQAIDLYAASEAGVHKPAEAMNIVNILNENMAALVLNRPNRDGFFRIRCVHNNHYLQSDDLNKDGRLDLSEDNTGIASIFYFDALDGEGNEGKGSLVSYKEGYYFTQGRGTDGHSGIYVCLQPIGKMGDVLTFDVPANKEFGSYNISSDNTQNQNGRRYLFGAAGNKTDGYYPDNGSDATQVNVANDLGGNTGYNWVLERVEELPLTINSYGYSTFYAPVALNVPEGVEAFICTGVDEQSELTLQSLDVIPAGTAVILKAEGLAGQEVYFTEPNNTPMPLAEGENYLHGGIYKTWRTPECQNKNPEMTSATGVNHNLPYLEEKVTDKVYTLSNKNGKVAMYQYAGNKFTHFRSFLKLPEAINVALASTLDFGEIIEGPTAIEEAPAISLEDAIIYDLSGRRVAEPGKGVYIVNGKKVYFK